MHAIRNQIRPKHQVLILNCYPRHQKNNVELKPNSSELSYLLYYASTRRSKMQKVVGFLDKKVMNDVRSVRVGMVAVTLQIITALIEKCPKDLPLYAESTLNIFETVLQSLDITMIEETIPTWQAFCSHQDSAVLAADQDQIKKYEDIVRFYASFASKDTPIQHKSAKSLPVRLRLRKAGLSAIQALAESQLLSFSTGLQLSVITPPVLENLYSESGRHLSALEEKKEDRELGLRSQQSAVPNPPSASTMPDLAAASGSIEVADRLAEQEIGAQALQALKHVFAVVSRGQLRLATIEVLKFMSARIDPGRHFPIEIDKALQSTSWPCILFSMICGWAPVQDRHVILVSAVGELTQTSDEQGGLEKQYVLATIIGWLLGSDIIFIGLSIMDVLVALLDAMSVLVKPAIHTKSTHHSSLDDGLPNGVHQLQSSQGGHKGQSDTDQTSTHRTNLLSQLQRCIGRLAVHIYYSEQISDIIGAILSRIRPAANAAEFATTALTGNGMDGLESSTPRRNIDCFFISDEAKLAGLAAIKEVLMLANWNRSSDASKATNRSPVPVHRWDGTEWLLRESSWVVRLTYAEVLLVWMELELTKSDLVLREESSRKSFRMDQKELISKEANLARRAVSNASHRDTSPRRLKSTFLPLLHLAIYDSALQLAAMERDTSLLHLLLHGLVAKLGLNSVQHGLPMIRRLQEDLDELEESSSKCQASSLVYGYLWTISMHFGFDKSPVGQAIAIEISHRLKNKTWTESIWIPPLSIQKVAILAPRSSLKPMQENVIATPERFDGFDAIVDKLAEGYQAALSSPPSSPPTSPSLKFATPVLEHTTPLTAPEKPAYQLPYSVKDDLLSLWTREAVIAVNSKLNDSHLGSPSGSPTAQGSGQFSGLTNRDSSLHYRSYGFGTRLYAPQPRHSRLHSAKYNSRPCSLRDTCNSDLSSLRVNRASQAATPMTCSSFTQNIVNVKDLKRALNGETSMPPSMAADGLNGPDQDDSATESMASCEGSELSTRHHEADIGLVRNVASIDHATAGHHAQSRSVRSRKSVEGLLPPRCQTAALPSTPNSARHISVSWEAGSESGNVPPVPVLPETYSPMSPPLAYRSARRTTLFDSPMTSARTFTKPESRTRARASSLVTQTVCDSLKRSISTRDGSLRSFKQDKSFELPKSVWSAKDLLNSIELDAVGVIPGINIPRAGTVLQPPY